MFARVYRISKVFNNKKLRSIAVRENDVMRLCAPFWILWLVYHILWMVSKTPPKKMRMCITSKFQHVAAFVNISVRLFTRTYNPPRCSTPLFRQCK